MLFCQAAGRATQLLANIVIKLREMICQHTPFFQNKAGLQRVHNDQAAAEMFCTQSPVRPAAEPAAIYRG